MGDQAAFTELYERTSAALYRTVRSMVGEFAFPYDGAVTIRGVPGSEAERYANEHGLPFEATT